jgi:hypothetical protein
MNYCYTWCLCRIGFTTEYKVDTVDLVIWRQVTESRARRRCFVAQPRGVAERPVPGPHGTSAAETYV